MLSADHCLLPNGESEIKPPPAIKTNPRINSPLFDGYGFAISKLPPWITEYVIKKKPANARKIPEIVILLIILQNKMSDMSNALFFT